MYIDKYQGIDEQNRNYGYIGQDDGGYFFTWLDTLEETLDSLDPNIIDPPEFDIDDARDFLMKKIEKYYQVERQ